jgi:hypothetical protein
MKDFDLWPCAAANPAIASRLQANALVARVAELVRSALKNMKIFARFLIQGV